MHCWLEVGNQSLTEGGREVMSLEATFWPPGYGALVDRFGTPGMLNTIPGEGWGPAQQRGQWIFGEQRYPGTRPPQYSSSRTSSTLPPGSRRVSTSMRMAR